MIKKLRHYYLFMKDKVLVADTGRYRACSIASMLVHMSFILAFAVLDCLPMLIYNIAAVLFYVFVLQIFIRKRKYVWCYTANYLDALISSMLACLMLGWTSGFSLYCLSMIPISFYMTHMTTGFKKGNRTAIIWSLFNLTLIQLVRIHVYINGSIYTYSSSVTLGIAIFNTAICFVIAAFFSVLYVFEIENVKPQLERKNAELKNLADYDSLTQLLNRHSMSRVLENTINKFDHDNEGFVACICDIDDFKKVNDIYGHVCGDRVLAMVSSILKETVGIDDTVCRWGGEEFVFIINKPMKEALETIELMRKRIKYQKVYYENFALSVTLTFGVAEYRSGCKQEELIQKVDERLYFGKTHGKDCIVCE